MSNTSGKADLINLCSAVISQAATDLHELSLQQMQLNIKYNSICARIGPNPENIPQELEKEMDSIMRQLMPINHDAHITREWFFDDSEEPMSFQWICNVLALDVKKIRRKLNNPSGMRQLAKYSIAEQPAQNV